jgi:hypothetical protein
MLAVLLALMRYEKIVAGIGLRIVIVAPPGWVDVMVGEIRTTRRT